MKTIISEGGNLFQIAATHLGNALQWVNVAQANNLTDPMLSGQNIIIIPPFSPAFPDGIRTQ